MEDIINRIKREIPSISSSIIKELEKDITLYLDKCGLFYKVFSRIKSSDSMITKINSRYKDGKYDYKMQDLIGIRIVLYFKEDVDLCEDIITKKFSIVEKVVDKNDTDTFKAQRINYVCSLPEKEIGMFEDAIWGLPVDKTFEIQIRTIFSEGWHEIEHDFRYKCKNDWTELEDLSRILNGIYATLENCDWTILSLLNEVSYNHYKNKNWIPMLKNTFRIRIKEDNEKSMNDILEYFNKNIDVAKKFFKIDRKEFLFWLAQIDLRIPLTLSNLVYLININQVKDTHIYNMTPKLIKDKCKDYM